MTLRCMLDDKIVDNVFRRLRCQCPYAAGVNHILVHARDNPTLDEREIDAGGSVWDLACKSGSAREISCTGKRDASNMCTFGHVYREIL